ncbi:MULTISPECIES: hypothetical protein [unclassified Mucilaginibacter]|uniref:hypothetical protein n=1 Tax=unclassified Mucilaginibacter TaxID=2617802 RepID=UPI002AC9A45F|nr:MULTISPECIES: hypothetical protein [unclassified Mucilaginibacter]MEB0263795.1 hypothetical protein [Mucilaginibacter sp. 10I4]MEB0278253.1 hypothetical protein [Mucilaginibacter sp. 10B2]MEB0300961.1 hypothetical protein [Mucilaginibacter sp. 5C4]WPX23899.1 hypothetical protein RHM67_01225 [Mucilaginibacter sp. 5C4]
MKNKKILFAMATLFVLISCQKEKAVKTVVPDQTQATINKIKVMANVDYVELQLMTRQLGESFDTYTATYNGCAIKLIGPGSYDFRKYPNLVNGVPVVAASLSTTDGTSFIQTVNSGVDGNVFEVTQGYMGGLPTTSFVGDFKTYLTALSTWLQSNSTGGQPLLGSYVSTSYSGPGYSKTYTGKIIRITQGSHLAIANMNYPLPPPIPPNNSPIPIQNLGDAVVPDEADPTKSYLLHGSGGNITECWLMVNNYYPNTNIKLTVNGTYTTQIPGSQDFHMWGSIIRADGSISKFNLQQQTN